MAKGDDEATGCIITAEDEPALVATITCCVAFVSYGAAVAAMGGAIPFLADHFHRSESQFGLAFTFRGVGYLIGTLSSAALLNHKGVTLSKELMACLALGIAGSMFVGILALNSFLFAMACFFMQGMFFGVVDTMGNCALPELWGRRVQPWMQALQAFYGIGCVGGPALVGAMGFENAFKVLIFMSFLPLLGMMGYRLLTRCPCGAKQMHAVAVPSDTPIDEEGARIAPLYLRLIVCFFFFVYVGIETGFAGWLPTYAILQGITTSNSAAAYLTSIVWVAITVGRVLAVLSAIFLSATAMLRIQLTLSLGSTLAALFLINRSYQWACIVSALVGFSLSCIWPVMMTLVGDYGFCMDANTTTMFMVGAILGEALVPVVMGWVMTAAGPAAMPVTVFAGVLVLLATYAVIHKVSALEMASSSRLHSALPCDEAESSPMHEEDEEEGIELKRISHII